MKTVEIIVKKSLKQPPLKTSVKYLNVFLPNDFVIVENQQKQINLNFQIKVPDNITHQIVSTTVLQKQPLDLRWVLTANSKYKNRLFSNLSIKQVVSHLNFQGTHKSQGYILYWARLNCVELHSLKFFTPKSILLWPT